MFEAAGDRIHSLKGKQYIRPYILGDMTSTVYPVGGGMEDWAYGAGWDNQDPDATMDKCSPLTQPSLQDDFFESQENVRCAIYLIETDLSKNPDVKTYGAREKLSGFDGKFMVTRNSVEERDPEKMFDGHINRNLRLATSMIDMSKPYIYVTAIKQV